MLSVYYLLVIRYSWKEPKLRSYRRWFHAPAVIGICAAFVSIKWVEPAFFYCTVIPPPASDSYWPISVFLTFPVGFTLLVATVNTIIVYITVHKQEVRSQKWRFPNGSTSVTARSAGSVEEKKSNVVDSKRTDDGLNLRGSSHRRSSISSQLFGSTKGSQGSKASNKLRRATLWQSCFYLGAFYFSWFILFYINVGFVDDEAARIPFGVWAFFLTISPLQGLTNCFVYVRPRLCFARRRSKDARQQQNGMRKTSLGAEIPKTSNNNDEIVNDALPTLTEPESFQLAEPEEVVEHLDQEMARNDIAPSK